MNNEEKTKIVDELYGSVKDTHNYDERYYRQQAKEAAAVTTIAMLRDEVPAIDIRTCIRDWYGVEISDHAMAILQAEAGSDEEEEALTGKRRADLSPSGPMIGAVGFARSSAYVNMACHRISFIVSTRNYQKRR